MDYSLNHSPGNESDRSEYARRLGARVGVNFGPVFESVSYLMGRYCKSSYSLKSCLEALNSDEKMRKKIAREIWYHYTHGVLVYDKRGVDLDDYNVYDNAYSPPDEDGTKVATGDEGAFVGNASDIVSNDDDDVETPTIKSDGEAAVGLTDDERLMAAEAVSFDDDGCDGDDVRNDDDDDDDIDADSDHYVDDVYTDGDDVNDDDDDATVQSDHTDSDDVDDDDVDNADDNATVQSFDTDGDYVNDDDVDNTDYYANDQSVVSDSDDVNNDNDDDDVTVQSDDDSTVPSDYDDVVVGSPNGGDNSNICDSTDSSIPADENVYTADSDEIRANSSGDDSANVPPEDNDSVSNGNFEELVSPNSYEENGDVNDDDEDDDAFNPSDEIVLPNSREGNGSDDLPLNNGEVYTPVSEFMTTTDEEDDDHSYTTGDPVDNFWGTLQEQCIWLYNRGFGEGDGKFKPDSSRRRARLKKIADFYFAEKMGGDYPCINYQRPTYHNGYEFGLTDYLRRLGKRLGVEFGPVFEGCAIKMGRYFRSTRTLQRCVDIINNDEDMRKDLARSVWHHFIEGIMQRIR